MPDLTSIACNTPQSQYLCQLQQQFGTTDNSKVQTNRKQYYSFVTYPTAGSTSLTFFGTSVGGSNRQLTNIQQAGKLDYPFLVKAIRTSIFCASLNIGIWRTSNSGDGRDANTFFSDIVAGFATAGLLQVQVGTRIRLQLPNPFLYAPPAFSSPEVHSRGSNVSGTLASSTPFAWLNNGKHNAYLVKPPFTIDPVQSWKISIDYPSGAIPIIGTGALASNTLYVGVILDGIEIRPLV